MYWSVLICCPNVILFFSINSESFFFMTFQFATGFMADVHCLVLNFLILCQLISCQKLFTFPQMFSKWLWQAKLKRDWKLPLSLCLAPSAHFEDRWWLFPNNLDPDEAPQNVGPHLRSKLFDTQIIYIKKVLMNTRAFANFDKNEYGRKNTYHAKFKLMLIG